MKYFTVDCEVSRFEFKRKNVLPQPQLAVSHIVDSGSEAKRDVYPLGDANSDEEIEEDAMHDNEERLQAEEPQEEQQPAAPANPLQVRARVLPKPVAPTRAEREIMR